MNVRELIEWLQQYPEEFLVVTASDEEGNDFHEAYELSHGSYDPNYREFSDRAIYVDDNPELDYDEDRPLQIDESNAVCIWP